MSYKFLAYSLLCFVTWHAGAQSSNATLDDIIESLTSAQTQIVYSNDFLKADEVMVADPINSLQSLRQFLHSIGFELEKVREDIFLIRLLQSKAKATRSSSPIVIGKITNKETGQTLSEAQVFTGDGTKRLSQNKRSGFYFSGNKDKSLNILIKAPGYISQFDEIKFADQQVIIRNYALEKAPEALENMYVTTSQFDFNSIEAANQTLLSQDELLSSPQTGNDPARAINKLPGMTSNGITAKSHVRGGKLNESQVILNGLALKNPYHFKDFFGIFSAINLSYVEELSLYAGVFPAKYGNHISSVMEIQSTEPSEDFVDLSLGVLSSHLTIGQVIDPDTQYLFSYRSGGDLLRTDLFQVDTGNPRFTDLFFNMQQIFSDGTVVNGNILHAKDTINLNLANEDESARAKYIDNNYWLSIENPVNEQLNFKSLVFYQTNNTNRTGRLFDDELQGSLFEDRRTTFYGFSGDIRYRASKKLAYSMGFELQQESTNINYTSTLNGEDFISELLNPGLNNRLRNHVFKNSGLRKSLYGNLRYNFNSKIYGDFGLRFDNQDWINELQISPRLNLSYFYDKSLTFRFGLGRHFQNQHVDGVLLENETLMYFEPESADIAVFEFQKHLNDRYNLRTELYYKKYKNVQPYYENLFNNLHLQPELFSDRIRVQADTAFSKGVELTVTSYYDQFNWSASYSFSEVKDVIDGREYLRSWDQQNAVKLNFEWFWRTWQLNALMQYHTGWPRTLIKQVNDSLIIGSRNADRNKDYLNLDLRLSYDTLIYGKKAQYWLKINNAFNRKNQCCSEYTYESNEAGQYTLTNEPKEWLPLIPSVGFDISF